MSPSRRRRAARAILGASILLGAVGVAPTAVRAEADGPDFYRVRGLAAGDMLNLRRGPGEGFEIIVGLPEGAAVDIHSRETHGGTEWCLVGLRESPQLQGHVACRFLGE